MSFSKANLLLSWEDSGEDGMGGCDSKLPFIVVIIAPFPFKIGFSLQIMS